MAAKCVCVSNQLPVCAPVDLMQAAKRMVDMNAPVMTVTLMIAIPHHAAAEVGYTIR